jgi:two-component system, LytTR family, response regulator
MLNRKTLSKVFLKDVILLKATINYTIVHLDGEKKRLVSHTLKYFESYFEEQGFIRVHRSCIINPKFIKEYNRSLQVLIMSDGEIVRISRRRQKILGF